MIRGRQAWAMSRSGAVAAAIAIAVGSAACSSGDSGPEGAKDSAPANDATGVGEAAVEGSTPVEGGADAPAEAARDAGPDATVDEGGADAAPEAQVDGGCTVGGFGQPTDLRCAGLYSDWNSKTVAAGIIEYDPGLHLWSDGAVKTRWIELPPSDAGAGDGGRMPIDTSNMDEWTFPVGTRFFKEFVLGGKRIETRMLWKKDASGWYRTTYQWTSDESSAPELTDGLMNADGNGYQIPSQSDCDTCHNGRRDGVLGFEAVSLASANATPLTVASLADAGWITSAPDASLAIPGNAVDVAALGYLHANCGIACHNGGTGIAAGTQFHMRLDVAKLATVQSTDTWTTGVNTPTHFFQIPGESTTIRIAPNDAGASCVFYRMSQRDGFDDAAVGTQMPPLDTHKVDEAGVGLITQWIAQGCL
jgi:hypothetical protein